MRALYLIAYDVSDPQRLRRVHALVKAHAYGGQKSVLECWLTDTELATLLARLARTIRAEEDRLLALRLDGAARVRTLGIALPPADPHFFYHG